MPDDTAVRAERLSYQYRSGHGKVIEALRDVSFDVRVGEFVAVVGRSGAGKSTLLHVLSRLLTPNSGRLCYPAFHSPPRVGYLFQGDAAFPWRRVERNLTYALEIHGEPRSVRRRRAEELCSLVDLNPAEYLHKYPFELSGGELRRVGLGMALAGSPDLLLVDEPTSAVDWITRRQLQRMIQDVMIKSSATTIVVTHDIEEAVWLSDRVIALRDGSIANCIDVHLPRPRQDELRTTESFRILENRVMAALEGTASANQEIRTGGAHCR